MSVILEFAANKQSQGFSPIILICGEQRLGKTMLAFLMAWQLIKEKFEVDKHYFTSVNEFALAFDKYNNKVLIYDEVGQELDPFRAMDKLNRAFSHIVQTQAFKTNILFVVLPFAIDFTKGHRKYVKAVIEVRKRGVYKAYSTYTWAANLNESKIRLMHLETMYNVPMPPQHIVDYYKSKKEKQTKDEIMQKELVKLGLVEKPKSDRASSGQQSHSGSQQTPSFSAEQIRVLNERKVIQT